MNACASYLQFTDKESKIKEKKNITLSHMHAVEAGSRFNYRANEGKEEKRKKGGRREGDKRQREEEGGRKGGKESMCFMLHTLLPVPYEIC